MDQRRKRVHTLDVRGYDLRPARPLWVLITHSVATAAVSELPELGPPMDHPGFFDRASPIAISELAAATSSSLPEGLSEEIASRKLSDVRALADAGPNDVTFLDNRKYLPQLSSTRAGACLVLPAFADRVPEGTVPLLTKRPYHGFALALRTFYPEALWSRVTEAGAPNIHPSARIERDCVIEPGAIIGAEAAIGRGSRIAAGAVVGYRVHVGRNCYVGPQVTLQHSLLGDRIIIHAGARIGQDGFGFAMGPEGHLKVPQIGRVIIQDDVEIGANTTIDRGALKDTVIGEGTKIDNLVQIGHNVRIGRHCVIVAHTGISGSTELGDFVVMGGQSGTAGHIKIGTGAQVAGASHPKDDIPPGARVAGTPARPLKEWGRELAAIKRLGRREN